MLLVVVFYILLHRAMRAPHRTDLRTSRSVAELNITTNIYASEIDTDGKEFDHITSDSDHNKLMSDPAVVVVEVGDSLLKGEGVGMKEGRGVAAGTGRRWRREGGDSEAVVLLNDVGGTEEMDEEESL